MKYKLRLYGLDTPELKPVKNVDNRNELIQSAKDAKQALEEKILNKIISVTFFHEDKYGRLLGNIFLNGVNINLWMIESGYAVPYFGKTKGVSV